MRLTLQDTISGTPAKIRLLFHSVREKVSSASFWFGLLSSWAILFSIATLLVCSIQNWMNSFGTSLLVQGLMWVAIAFALLLNAGGINHQQQNRFILDRDGTLHSQIGIWLATGFVFCCAGLVLWLLPTFYQMAFVFVQRIPESSFQTNTKIVLALFPLALIGLTIPIHLICCMKQQSLFFKSRIPLGSRSPKANEQSHHARFNIGGGVWIVLVIALAAYFQGTWLLQRIAGTLLLLVGTVLVWVRIPSRLRIQNTAGQNTNAAEDNFQEDSTSDLPSPTTLSMKESFHGRNFEIQVSLSVIEALFLGIALALVERAVSQIVPWTALQFFSAMAGFMLGVGLSGLYASRRTSTQMPLIPAIGKSVCWLVLVLLCFPLLMRTQLLIHAYISSTLVLVLTRMLWGCCWIPLGMVLQQLVVRSAKHSSLSSKRLYLLRICVLSLGIPAGYLGVPYLFGRGIDVWNLIPWMCAIAGILFVFDFWLQRKGSFTDNLPSKNKATSNLTSTRFRHVKGWLIPAFMIVLLACSLFIPQTYQAEKAARLLFSAQVFEGIRQQTEIDQLLVMDEGRLVSLIEGSRGTYTVWQYRGVQQQIRENGIPQGIKTTNAEYCPQFTGDVLPALLPLSLHENPTRTMLLGFGSGHLLEASLACTSERILCVESDPAFHKLLTGTLSSDMEFQMWRDPRISYRSCDPIFAVMGSGERFDVIISSPHQPAMLHQLGKQTEDFFRLVKGRLQSDGIFCQRLVVRDLGSFALQTIAQSMLNVFADVSLIEITPGEYVFLGTPSNQGLLREGLLERLQTPKFRRQLRRLGWDWVMPLSIRAYNHEGLKELCRSHQQSHRMFESQFAFSLPVEVMKWGNKHEELTKGLAPLEGRLLKWMNLGDDEKLIARRIEEVIAARNLKVTNPDQPWFYRKTVKEYLTKHPRKEIHHVAGKGPRHKLHPDDQFRVDYFHALGKALEDPTPEHIEQISRFTTPYDPLLSFFIHHEAYRLYEQVALLHSKEKSLNQANFYATERFHHLLSAIYYADPTDRSIRDVTRALQLVSDHSEVTKTELERWDHLNGLIEMLRGRWRNRGMGKPFRTYSVLLNDIEKSVTALEAATKTMDGLQKELSIPDEYWIERKEIIASQLTRPLRTYERYLIKDREQNETQKQIEQQQQSSDRNEAPVAN